MRGGTVFGDRARRQIAALQASLGVALVSGPRHALVLTEAGVQLAERLTPAFGAITAFGLLVASVMWVIQKWHAHNCIAHKAVVDHLVAIAKNDQMHG